MPLGQVGSDGYASAADSDLDNAAWLPLANAHTRYHAPGDAECIRWISSFSHSNCGRQHSDICFADKEIEAQRAEITCPGTHGWKVNIPPFRASQAGLESEVS